MSAGLRTFFLHLETYFQWKAFHRPYMQTEWIKTLPFTAYQVISCANRMRCFRQLFQIRNDGLPLYGNVFCPPMLCIEDLDEISTGK